MIKKKQFYFSFFYHDIDGLNIKAVSLLLQKSYSHTVNTINILIADATVIKTAARVTPTYFLMKGSRIQEKVAAPSIDHLFTTLNRK